MFHKLKSVIVFFKILNKYKLIFIKTIIIESGCTVNELYNEKYNVPHVSFHLQCDRETVNTWNILGMFIVYDQSQQRSGHAN